MKRFLYRQHGKYSLELKIRYLIHRRFKQRRNYFNIKLYLFFPYSFNIHEGSYPKDHFYEDQKLYLRFNTPVFSLDELLQEENSPFIRIRHMLTKVGEQDSELNNDDYMYEAKLCGSIYKSVLRDSIYKIRKQLKRTAPETWKTDTDDKIDKMYATAQHFHQSCTLADRLQEDIRYHTRLIDEYVSLELEKYLLWLFDFYSSKKGSDNNIRKLQEYVSAEMDYRRSRGYASVSDSNESPDHYEEYAYRAKMLKRYNSEVLFFDVRRKYQGKRVEHILYAAAAGIAMGFATAIAFFGQTRFGNLSSSLFILLVISYMLKDRIKDIFRDLFSKTLGSFFYDRRITLFDPRNRRPMAHIKERAAFTDHHKLPKEITKIRSRGAFEEFISGTTAETVLLYEKNVRLNTKTIKRLHSRIKGIADINIIGLQRMLRYLSVQGRNIPIVSEGGIKKLIPVKRIYHLNVIVWYKGDDAEFIDRIRLIVDGKGIKRIEKIESIDNSPTRHNG